MTSTGTLACYVVLGAILAAMAAGLAWQGLEALESALEAIGGPR